MTDTSKFGRVAGVVGTAASTYAKGSAGIGFALAQRGYGVARQQLAKRKAAAALKPAVASAPRISVRTRRFLVFGSLAAVAAGIAVVVGRRRHDIAPPADAPPSLADYSDTPDAAPAPTPETSTAGTSQEGVNGSTPAQPS